MGALKIVLRRGRFGLAAAAGLASMAVSPLALALPTSTSAECAEGATPLDAVIDACSAALQTSSLQPPARADRLLTRGEAELLLGQIPQAVADFGQVIEIARQSPGAAAPAASKDAIIPGPQPNAPNRNISRLRHDLATAYYARGMALNHEGGQSDAAMADLDAALTLEPAYPAALWQRALTWHQKGRTDRALADLNDAIRIRPNWAPPYVTRGAAYSSQGDRERAIAEFTEALRLDPRYVGAYLDRAWDREAMHDDAGALADLDAAIKLLPNDPSLFAYRAGVFQRENDREKALADYTTAVELYGTQHMVGIADEAPGDAQSRYAQVLTRRSGIYVELGNIPAATADADHAIQLSTALDLAWNSGCWTRAVGNVDLVTALADCDHALQLSTSPDERAEILDSRAVVRYRQGEFDKAVADEDAAIALAPDTAAFRFTRGLAEERLGKAAEGRADIAAAVAVDPKIADRYARWGLKPD